MNYYPIAIKLENRLALVIGGGKVAQRKILALCETGARIKVVSPKLTPLLKRLAKKKYITWIQRNVHNSDLPGAAIIIAATDNSGVNRAVSRWAERARILVNVVDKTSLSDFIAPAVFRIKRGIVTVYTDGRDPKLSRDIKNFLKEKWNDFLSYRNRL